MCRRSRTCLSLAAPTTVRSVLRAAGRLPLKSFSCELLPWKFLSVVSSPGLTGRSSNPIEGILDCPVKPGNDTGRAQPNPAYTLSIRRLSAQLEALNLAGRRFRQVAPEFDPVRILVRREPFPAMLLQRLGCFVAGRGGRLQDHE